MKGIDLLKAAQELRQDYEGCAGLTREYQGSTEWNDYQILPGLGQVILLRFLPTQGKYTFLTEGQGLELDHPSPYKPSETLSFKLLTSVSLQDPFAWHLAQMTWICSTFGKRLATRCLSRIRWVHLFFYNLGHMCPMEFLWHLHPCTSLPLTYIPLESHFFHL